MKIGTTIIIIGFPGSGKTPTTKNILKKSNIEKVYIYDPRGEYFFDEKNIVFKYTNGKKFIEVVKNKKKSFIIFEEATSLINSVKNKDLTELFIAIEHNINISVLIFHSLIDAPKNLLRLSQYIILFPTSDDEEDIKKTRKQYYNEFIEVKKLNKNKKRGEFYKSVTIKQR